MNCEILRKVEHDTHLNSRSLSNCFRSSRAFLIKSSANASTQEFEQYGPLEGRSVKMPTQKILNGIVAESWIGLLLTEIDVCQCELYCVRCIRSSLCCTDLNLQVHFISLSDFTDITSLIQVFLTNIYMVTFKGHAVASLSRRESRYANRSTFQLGFDATLFFGFSFLPSSSSSCSNALVPLPRKSGLLIWHAFVKMKLKIIYINLHRQRGRQHKIREGSVAVRDSLKVKH